LEERFVDIFLKKLELRREENRLILLLLFFEFILLYNKLKIIIVITKAGYFHISR
jgi:hypothetical protein